MRNRNEPIRPVWGDHIRFKINVGNVFFPRRTYKITGVAYAKPKGEKNERKEYWEITDIHNAHIKPKPMSKEQFNRLFDEEKIIETVLKTI